MQYKKVLLTATCLLGMAGATMAAPVGMVIKLDGTPTLKVGGKSQALRKLQRLEPGSTIACGGGEGAVVVLFASGERFAIKSNSQGTVGQNSVAGGSSLGKLSGASAGAAGALGRSRAGAIMGRVTLARQDLSSASKGWLPKGERTLSWQPIDGATAYTFALCDRHGNVLWSTYTDSPDSSTPEEARQARLKAQPNLSAQYPADAPELEVNKPYIWRLTGYGKVKPLPEARWGFITWLDNDGVEALTAAGDLQAQATANPDGAESLLQEKIEIASQYGVFDNTFDALEALATLTNKNGASEYDEVIRKTYADISPFATYLYEETRKSKDKKESSLFGTP